MNEAARYREEEGRKRDGKGSVVQGRVTGRRSSTDATAGARRRGRLNKERRRASEGPSIDAAGKRIKVQSSRAAKEGGKREIKEKNKKRTKRNGRESSLGPENKAGESKGLSRHAAIDKFAFSACTFRDVTRGRKRRETGEEVEKKEMRCRQAALPKADREILESNPEQLFRALRRRGRRRCRRRFSSSASRRRSFPRQSDAESVVSADSRCRVPGWYETMSARDLVSVATTTSSAVSAGRVTL